MLSAIIGVLSVIVGFALLRSPFQSLEVMIFVIGVLFVAQGIIRFVSAFEVKQGRNWGIFMGILGVIAGIIVLEYPGMSAALARAVRRHLADHARRDAVRRGLPAPGRRQGLRPTAPGRRRRRVGRPGPRAILSRGADLGAHHACGIGRVPGTPRLRSGVAQW